MALNSSFKKNTLNTSFIVRKALTAFVTTVIVFLVVAYMNLGHLNIFKKSALIEMGIAFIFLLILFWMHRIVSRFFNRGRIKIQNPIIKAASEMVLIIIITVGCYFITSHVPLVLIFSSDAILPVRLRTAYVISIVISLFFYYFVERERTKRQLQAELLRSARLQKESFQAQLESLKNQVNPHFLFNSLNVLHSLIYKDQDQAATFTDRLSDLYRYFLDTGNEPLVPLNKELELTKSYIYLIKARFGNAVMFELKVTDKTDELFLPPGSLQMLVENAIKHNGSTSNNPLRIKIEKKGDSLVVTNNLKARREKITSTKTGLKNIESRYRFLTQELPEFRKTATEFIATLPLLKVEKYENRNH